MSNSDLLKRFDQAMFEIHDRALSQAKYEANFFLSMLHEHGGLETGRKLIHSKPVSDGYTALWERGRLDLTVEALIIDCKLWQSLFNEEELRICEQRLKDYKYIPKHS